MKWGLMLLFLAMILLSSVAYAEDTAIAPVEVGSTTRNTLPNGDVQLILNNQLITQYNPVELKKIFEVNEVSESLELSLRKARIGDVWGKITADVPRKRLIIESSGKNNLAYAGILPNFELYGRKIIISITSDKEVVASAHGANDNSAYLNVTLEGNTNTIMCRGQMCNIELLSRTNPINKDKFFLNISGNAYLAKDPRLDKLRLKEGNNEIYDINVSGLLVKKVNPSALFFEMIIERTVEASSFGEVNFEGKDVLLSAVYYTNKVIDPAFSIFVIKPSISGKDVKIKKNNSRYVQLSTGSGLVTKGISYYKDDKLLFEILRSEATVYNGKIPLLLSPTLSSSSVIEINGKRLSISLKPAKEYPALKVYPGYVDYLDFSSFLLADTKSFAYAELGTKRLGFFNDKVVVNGAKWQDFGMSFKIPILDSSVNILSPGKVGESAYSILECRLSENKCYLNGKEVAGYAEQKIRKCQSASQCPGDQECMQGICINKAKCQKLDIPGMNGPIGIAFVNNRAMPKPEFKNYVSMMLGLPGTPSVKQMFGKEPFKSLRDKFTIYYIDDANVPLGSMVGTPVLGLISPFGQKMCPGATHSVFISSEPTSIGSLAIYPGIVMLEKRQQDVYTNVISHEFAHACCGIADEYYSTDPKLSLESYKRFTKGRTFNCAIDDADAKSKGWPSTLVSQAKSNKWQGCGGTCPSGCSLWLKPSKESIMSKASTYDNFNDFVSQFMRGRIR